jgi:hypothetical protein
MFGMKVTVKRLGLTAQDLRSFYEKQRGDPLLAARLAHGANHETDPDNAKRLADHLRAWTVLGVAYGSGLAPGDLKWLEGIATMTSRETEPEQLAAIHAVRAASGYNVLDSAGTMQRVAGSFLARALDSAAAERPAQLGQELKSGLTLSLGALDDLGEAVPVEELVELARRDASSESLAALCFETLARAGGAEGARAVVNAAQRGEPAALQAVAALRDESATPDLLAWVESGWRDGGDAALASAAVSGLLSTGTDVALEVLESLLRPDDSLPPEKIEARRRIAIEGLAGLREPRSRGLYRRAMHLIEPLRDDLGIGRPDEERWVNLSRATMVRDYLMPPGSTRDEICLDLRRALGVLPVDSDEYGWAMYDLARVARPEDVTFLEASLCTFPPRVAVPSIEEFIREARER